MKNQQKEIMQMRKTNHSYQSNKSNVPNKKIEKGSKYDYNNGGFSALNESEGDMNDDENDSNDEIDEQSPNEDQLDEEDIFIDNKKALTPTGGSHNNLHQDKSREIKDSSFRDNQKRKKG
jgi:hypothetical protein